MNFCDKSERTKVNIHDPLNQKSFAEYFAIEALTYKMSKSISTIAICRLCGQVHVMIKQRRLAQRTIHLA